MRTKQFSCDSDRRMAKSWVPPPFFLDFCLNFCRDADLQEQDHFPRLAACRRRFFFGPNSVSPGKGPFSSAGGLPQALFFGKNDGFGGKMTFLRFIRDVNNPIGSLSSIFVSIRPFPKKKLVLSLFSKNLQKRHFFRNFCFPLTGFFAWEFS